MVDSPIGQIERSDLCFKTLAFTFLSKMASSGVLQKVGEKKIRGGDDCLTTEGRKSGQVVKENKVGGGDDVSL